MPNAHVSTSQFNGDIDVKARAKNDTKFVTVGGESSRVVNESMTFKAGRSDYDFQNLTSLHNCSGCLEQKKLIGVNTTAPMMNGDGGGNETRPPALVNPDPLVVPQAIDMWDNLANETSRVKNKTKSMAEMQSKINDINNKNNNNNNNNKNNNNANNNNNNNNQPTPVPLKPHRIRPEYKNDYLVNNDNNNKNNNSNSDTRANTDPEGLSDISRLRNLLMSESPDDINRTNFLVRNISRPASTITNITTLQGSGNGNITQTEAKSPQIQKIEEAPNVNQQSQKKTENDTKPNNQRNRNQKNLTKSDAQSSKNSNVASDKTQQFKTTISGENVLHQENKQDVLRNTQNKLSTTQDNPNNIQGTSKSSLSSPSESLGIIKRRCEEINTQRRSKLNNIVKSSGGGDVTIDNGGIKSNMVADEVIWNCVTKRRLVAQHHKTKTTKKNGKVVDEGS